MPSISAPLFERIILNSSGKRYGQARNHRREYMDKKLNPAGVDFVDLGLGGVVRKTNQNGKFRVPTLRNVALSAPYMHNGVLKTLREVVMFYSTRDTGPWPAPEVRQNMNITELGNLRLSQQDVDDLVTFMKTLTDGYRRE